MLTIFAAPKPFYGYIGVIQTNAIQSWLLLRPECEVILFGDEEGMAEELDFIKENYKNTNIPWSIDRRSCDWDYIR